MPGALLWLAATIQQVAKAMLGLCDNSMIGCVSGIGQNRSPPAFGFRQITAEEHDVASADAAGQNRSLIACARGDSSRFGVCRVGAIEIRLEAANATHPHPRADPIGHFEPLVAHLDHRMERVFSLVEMQLLLEVERVREQRWRNEGEIPSAVRFTRRPNNAAQVRGLGPFARQLGAIALGGRPLVAEDVRRWWLATGSEQVDKAES